MRRKEITLCMSVRRDLQINIIDDVADQIIFTIRTRVVCVSHLTEMWGLTQHAKKEKLGKKTK